MIKVDNILLTDDIKDVHFVCDLKACQGACCVQGDSGAPLEQKETRILEKIYPEVKPYLSKASRKAIKQQGTWILDTDGDPSTPLVNGQECAYTIFEEGTAFCGIEKAHLEGKIKFKKPISCHLYPIRVHEFKNVAIESLNYDKWSICDPACKLGASLQVPLYKFLKEPLIRKYGAEWYAQLVTEIEG